MEIIVKYISTLLLLFNSFHLNAVVIRYDVDPNLYKVNNLPQFYIDMPFQGGSINPDILF